MIKCGIWLKSWRYDLNKSQKEFSEYLGLSIRTIQNWESRGITENTLKLLELIRKQEREIQKLKNLQKL